MTKVKQMSIVNRAYRNVFRKAARTVIVALALGLSIAAILSVYTGIEASTENTQKMIDDYEDNIIAMTELSETQERLITVSSGGRFGGGFGGGMGGGFRPDPDEDFNFNRTPITEDVIENISSVEHVEDVIPIISRPMGELNLDEMRDQLRDMPRPDDGGGGIPPGGGGGGSDRMMSMFDY